MEELKTMENNELVEDEINFAEDEVEETEDIEADEDIEIAEETEDEELEAETDVETEIEDADIGIEALAAELEASDDGFDVVDEEIEATTAHFNNNTDFLRKFSESFSDKFVLLPNENINYKAKKREQDAKRAAIVEKLEVKYRIDKKY